MKLIYIASPYTIGDQAENVGNQIRCANELMDLGFAPISPLCFTHFQHMMFPRPHEEWMEYDKTLVQICHGLLRLPGESKGADIEVAHALQKGVPVFKTIFQLMAHFRPDKENRVLSND
jgi:Domain of unknown function (DUF1937)